MELGATVRLNPTTTVSWYDGMMALLTDFERELQYGLHFATKRGPEESDFSLSGNPKLHFDFTYFYGGQIRTNLCCVATQPVNRYQTRVQRVLVNP